MCNLGVLKLFLVLPLSFILIFSPLSMYFYFILFSVYECVFVYHMHVQFLWKSKEGVDPMELELGVIVSHHVGTGNFTQVKSTSALKY